MNRLIFFKIIVASIMLLGLHTASAQMSDTHLNSIMTGLSNKGLNKEKPYLTAGDRTYIVGTQSGDFPDLGAHVAGEMGGLWMHPIKLLDGFWVKLSNVGDKKEAWLNEAKEFVNKPYGNTFIYAPVLDGIEAERFQFCPQGKEGMVIQYQLKNTTAILRKLQLEFMVKTDLSPVWFSKENNIFDATDQVEWKDDKKVFVAKDNAHPWYSVWGSSLPAIGYQTGGVAPTKTLGLGNTASTLYQLTIKPNETIHVIFVVSGSNKNEASAIKGFETLIKSHALYLTLKKQHYAALLKKASIDIPDKKLQEAYTWGKLNTEWLVCDLPGIGRFLGAGAIEYPWLFGCDNEYAVQGVVASGDPDLAKASLRILKNESEKAKGNGRIIHEMSTNGFVGNKGNTQETPQFAIAVWKVFEWTGDKQFLSEMYPYIKKGINWLLTEQDENKNLFPKGYGIMEVKGLDAELIDVAVYTQQALEVASRMAALFNEAGLQYDYAHKAAILKEKINTQFWDEAEGIYGDFYGTKTQAISVAKGAIEQLQDGDKKDSILINEKQEYYKRLLHDFSSFPANTEKGWSTNKNWVINTPLETGIAPREKAIRLLDKIRNEHCGAYGPYLSAVEGRYMMTIATGVQAMASSVYGRTDESLWYVDKIAETFSRVLPGSISEMMPDYGCPVQAWTIYGLALPLVTHVLGIHPEAYKQEITFTPHLPSNWDHAAIADLPVGSNIISFSILKKEKYTTYTLKTEVSDWMYTLDIKGLKGKKYKLNGKEQVAKADQIQIKGKTNKVEVLL